MQPEHIVKQICYPLIKSKKYNRQGKIIGIINVMHTIRQKCLTKDDNNNTNIVSSDDDFFNSPQINNKSNIFTLNSSGEFSVILRQESNTIPHFFDKNQKNIIPSSRYDFHDKIDNIVNIVNTESILDIFREKTPSIYSLLENDENI